ncbi:MAG: hypothetical protein DRO99_01645 [Candidatus Aenigmatarchaeota archaeon]|nr:MAG: hypothetical protein DRO99_01645 [Candidatus Aenigmarchaeota archaeon]
MQMAKIPVRLRGPFSGLTGYGRCFCGIAKYLLKSRRLAVEVLSLYNNPQPSADSELVAQSGIRFDVRHWGLLFGIPPLLPSLGTEYRVIYTMYEADDIPRQWRTYVKQADEIWVPSRHCAEVFGAYNPRIRVVHLGVSEFFRPTQLDKKYYRQKLGFHEDWQGYWIGTAGVMSHRKGVDVLVRAFREAFGTQSDVKLLIKTRDTRWLPPIDDPRVIVIDEDWPEEKMRDFYWALDLFVLPSRGEGFGMPPLEAARCGTPALVTAWSGMLEYIDNDGIWGIEVAGLVPTRGMAADHAYYAEPDLADFVDKLRFLYENRPGVGRNYNYWTYREAAKRFEKAILESIRLRR